MASAVRVAISWSGGKESALVLERLRLDEQFDVCALLTTCKASETRVAHSAVAVEVIEAQATTIDLPLHRLNLPADCSINQREELRRKLLSTLRAQGVDAIAFGDIDTGVIRPSRERSLRGADLSGVFPLWQSDTEKLAREIVARAIRAVVVCVDATRMSPALLGVPFDETFIDALPSGVDACGEHAEFDTLVTAAPSFRQPIAVEVARHVHRTPFVRAAVRLA